MCTAIKKHIEENNNYYLLVRISFLLYTKVILPFVLPLKVVGGRMKFFDEVSFVHNRVDGSLGGALYLLSFSQMVLEAGAHLSFINNAGRYVVISLDEN